MSKKKFEDPLGQPFEFPDAILKMIEECSPYGFVLFYINSEGEPNARAAFAAEIFEMGLRSYATKFLNGINESEDMSFMEQNMFPMDGIDEENDEFPPDC
jgi:hypothetical protein